MKVLILATAAPQRVAAAADEFCAEPGLPSVTVAAPRTFTGSLQRLGWQPWVVGDSYLTLDKPMIRSRISAFDRIVIPVAFPTHPFHFVLRLMEAVPRPDYEIWLGPRTVIRDRRTVAAILWGLSWILYPPLGSLILVCRSAEGALLLAIQLLARAVARRRQRDWNGGPVCHVITSLGLGGAQRQLALYLEHTRVPKQEIVVLALDPCSDPENLARVEQLCGRVEVIGELAQQSWLGRLGILLAPRITWLVLLRRRVLALKPRVVLAWLFLANVVTAPAARLAGAPRVLASVRNLSVWKRMPEFRCWWYRAADRLSAPLNDLIVCNSRPVAEDYASWSGVDPSRLTVVHNGVEPALEVESGHDVRQELGIGEQEVVLLVVARLSPEKNIDLLIECVADLRRRGTELQLVVVGDGEEGQDLEQLCSRYRVSDRVHLVGRRADVHQFYRSADIFALPSQLEGLPNALLEAQSHGLPAVASAVGGILDVIVDRETGLLVPAGDKEALTGALESLVADPDLRRRLGDAAARRIASHFTMGAASQRLDAVIGSS